MSIHREFFAAFKEGVGINVLHSSRIDESDAAEKRGEKSLPCEVLGFIPWDQLAHLQKWAWKESDKKLFKVEGLVFAWEKGGPAVYVASPSAYFAPMELLADQWSHAYLKWIAKQRTDQKTADEPRPYGKIQERLLADVVHRHAKTHDGEALLRHMLGFDAIDSLARQCNEALAELESEFQNALAELENDFQNARAQLQAAADKLNPHEKVKHSLAFLSEVTGSNDAARKILKRNGVNALSALPAEFCPVVIREAERAAVVTLAAKSKRTVKGLSKMTATQLRSVSNRLLG